MGKRRNTSGSTLLALILLSFTAGFAFAFILLKYAGPAFMEEERPAPVAEVAPKEPPEAPPPPAAVQEEPPSRPAPRTAPSTPSRARVAIVIDDMGQDMGKIRSILGVREPITVAVLPHLPRSREVASLAHSNGLEVLLHLPMEPKDPLFKPGKGALHAGMTPEDVRRSVETSLRDVPHASGMNNHMGSRFTEDPVLMKVVLDVVKEKGMYFLDSRTTSNSVAGRLAKDLGVRNMSRNVFLDNVRKKEYIRGQLLQAVSIAKKRGNAIAIGHPYPETIEVLRESLPELSGDGVRVVRLSELMGPRSP